MSHEENRPTRIRRAYSISYSRRNDFFRPSVDGPNARLSLSLSRYRRPSLTWNRYDEIISRLLRHYIPVIRGKPIITDITTERKFIVHVSFLRCYRWLLYGTNKNKERISRVCWLFWINRRRRHRSIRKEVKIINKTAPRDSGCQQVRFMRMIVYMMLCK